MKKIYVAIAVVALTLTACNNKTEEKVEATLEEVTPTAEILDTPAVEEKQAEKQLAERALAQEFVNLEGKTVTLQQIVDLHKGQPVVIDIWASWCPDCIKALPSVAEIKKEFTTTAFVNLSLDKTQEKWKETIAKHEIQGDHYFSTEGKGMKGDFGKALDLNWVPRYIVLDKTGEVVIYNATEKNFEEIKAVLNKIQ